MMRWWLAAIGAASIGIATPAMAQAAPVGSAQSLLDSILYEMKPDDVALRRSACVMGRAPKLAADAREAGFARPDASAWCVAVLTRQGRDGTLGYVRDLRSDTPTPAVAFDSGFVGGYLKRESLPAGAPNMATLLPIAERCLEQREANGQLCSSVGYMLGLRAATGETISVR